MKPLLHLEWQEDADASDIHDIHQLQANETLQDSRDRHRRLIEMFPVGVFRMAAGYEGRFLLVNCNLVQTLCYPSAKDLQTPHPIKQL